MINTVNTGNKGNVNLIPAINGVYFATKLFFSAVNEELWLNKLASQGYEFCGRKFSKYYFKKNSSASNYYFSVGYSLVSSTKGELCDLTKKEAAERVEKRCDIIDTYCTKVYYKTAITSTGAKSEASDVPSKDAASKRRHVRNRLAFNLGMFMFSLSLLCYNLMYWVRFSATNAFVRYDQGILNDYQEKEYSLWTITPDLRGWFGEYPCVPHISFFLCLTIIFLPFVVFYLDQYLYTKSFEKRLNMFTKRSDRGVIKKWAGR